MDKINLEKTNSLKFQHKITLINNLYDEGLLTFNEWYLSLQTLMEKMGIPFATDK